MLIDSNRIMYNLDLRYEAGNPTEACHVATRRVMDRQVKENACNKPCKHTIIPTNTTITQLTQ